MGAVIANEVRLVYDVRGTGDPVLLVCGTGQRAATWDLAGRPALDDAGYRTIAFDNRGTPPSGCPPPPYTVDAMALDTIGLVEQLEVGPVHLVGYSLGALIAQTVALRRPDLVRTAVLLFGGGNISPHARLRMEIGVALALERHPAAAHHDDLEAVDNLLAPDRRHDEDAVAGALELARSLRGNPDPDGRAGQLTAGLAWARADHLTELASAEPPFLVVAAEHDANFPPGSLRRVADRIPDAELVVVEGSPHVPLAPEHVRALGTAMLDYLDRHRGPRPGCSSL